VVISSVPVRETLEDSQFEQAMSLREAGVAIPDSVLIDNSRLNNKANIVKQIEAANNSPEAQEQAQIAKDMQLAEIDKTKAETAAKMADTGLKTAKGEKEMIAAQKDAITPPEDNGIEVKMMQAQADMQIAREKHELEMKQMQEKQAFEEDSRQREEARKEKESAAQIVTNRVSALTAAENGGGQPQEKTKEKTA
jgi:hypothetical protein